MRKVGAAALNSTRRVQSTGLVLLIPEMTNMLVDALPSAAFQVLRSPTRLWAGEEMSAVWLRE
jgi:hypothetical protein